MDLLKGTAMRSRVGEDTKRGLENADQSPIVRALSMLEKAYVLASSLQIVPPPHDRVVSECDMVL